MTLGPAAPRSPAAHPGCRPPGPHRADRSERDPSAGGLPPKFEHPAQLPDLIPESFQVILEEWVPVFSVG